MLVTCSCIVGNSKCPYCQGTGVVNVKIIGPDPGDGGE
jgi:hypothetical protein